MRSYLRKIPCARLKLKHYIFERMKSSTLNNPTLPQTPVMWKKRLALVYQLHGLTDEEIKIVEGQI